MRPRAEREADPASSRNTSSVVTGERDVCKVIDFIKGVRLRMKKCGMFEGTMGRVILFVEIYYFV